MNVVKENPIDPLSGWRLPAGSASLAEVHGSIAIPHEAGFWRKLLAFAGPRYLGAGGCRARGNWATARAGGGRFVYTVLPLIMISNLMGFLLGPFSPRLGIA